MVFKCKIQSTKPLNGQKNNTQFVSRQHNSFPVSPLCEINVFSTGIMLFKGLEPARWQDGWRLILVSIRSNGRTTGRRPIGRRRAECLPEGLEATGWRRSDGARAAGGNSWRRVASIREPVLSSERNITASCEERRMTTPPWNIEYSACTWKHLHFSPPSIYVGDTRHLQGGESGAPNRRGGGLWRI